MRRNVMAYKAPPRNEGYDIVCIHPNARHRILPGQQERVLVQVKSRYQSDSDLGVILRGSQSPGFTTW